jgi:branched-chain amino acid transport system permease protein
MGLAAIGLDLVFGYGGMISFGHAAFLGVGAYAVGILASYGIAEGLLALPVAVACAALAGLIIGALSIRTSGVFFIMITLAFAQMLYYVAIGLEAFGGDNGMPLKLPTTIGGTLDLSKPQLLYWVALACVLATLYLGGKVVRSEFGLALRAIRDNEQRMQTLGYATYRYKVVAYTVSGGICGLAGALLANVDSYVGPSMFHWFTSGLLMVMVILGGQGTLIGPLLGALVYVVLEEALSQLTEHWMVIFGPLLIVIVLLRNRG